MDYAVLDNAWRKGYKAYLEGYRLVDNPFGEEIIEYYEWISGFEDAEDEEFHEYDEGDIYDEY